VNFQRSATSTTSKPKSRRLRANAWRLASTSAALAPKRVVAS
jgi:hypothetical protein